MGNARRCEQQLSSVERYIVYALVAQSSLEVILEKVTLPRPATDSFLLVRYVVLLHELRQWWHGHPVFLSALGWWRQTSRNQNPG